MIAALRRWRERRRLLREATRFDAMASTLAGLSAEPRMRQHAAALREEARRL